MKIVYKIIGVLMFVLMLVIYACQDLHQEDYVPNGNAPNTEAVTRSSQVESDQYYWHDGQKVVLYKKEGQEFVLRQESSQTRTAQGMQSVWAVEEISEVQDTTNVIYRSSVYQTTKGEDAIFSNLFFVKLKQQSDYAILEEMAEQYGVTILGNAANMDLWYKLSCDLSSDYDAVTTANIFYESGLFKYSHPDPKYTIVPCSTVPSFNDPHFENQWYLHDEEYLDIDYPEAAQITTGSPDVKIAVIELLVLNHSHEDLNINSENIYKILAGEIQSVGSGDENYGEHPTKCVGIINAPHNDIGIVGIAPNCEILSIALGGLQNPNVDFSVSSEGVALAFNFAQEQGADVISCSWNLAESFSTDLIDASIREALQDGRNNKGCVVVFSAGNKDTDDSSVKYPANCNDSIIVVGAMSQSGARLSSSCFGSELDIMAPGENIYTTMPTNSSDTDYPILNYGYFGETSSACPQVAAVAGLILSTDSTLTMSQVTEKLLRTTTKRNNWFLDSYSQYGWWNEEYGYGMLNAYNALSSVHSISLIDDVYNRSVSYNVVGEAVVNSCDIVSSCIVIRSPRCVIDGNVYFNTLSQLRLYDNTDAPVDTSSFDVYPKTSISILPGSFGPVYDSCYLP